MKNIIIALVITLSLLEFIAAATFEIIRDTNTPFKHAINGPGFARNHRDDPFVYVGSGNGQYIRKLNIKTGVSTEYVGQPLGEADDIDVNAQGTIAYTGLYTGVVRTKTVTGSPKVVGTANPVSPNGVSFDVNGNLYFSQFPAGRGLFKVDPNGVQPQQLVVNLTSGMNGFDFGPDGKIYGPLPMEGKIVKVDVNTKRITDVSTGFIDVEGVRWDENKKRLYALDTGVNTIYEIDPMNGAKTAIVSVPEPAYIDNFRVYYDSFIISEQLHNSVLQYNMTTKTTKLITPYSQFTFPMGVSVVGDVLYIADYINLKRYYIPADDLTIYARSGFQPAPNPDVSYGIFNIYANQQFTVLSCNFDGRVQIRQTVNNAVVTQVPAGWPYGTSMSEDYKTLLVNDFGTGLTVFTGDNFARSRVLTLNSGKTTYVTLTGMVLDGGNFVYVADYSTGDILRVNYRSGQLTVVYRGLSKPEGITIGYEGKCRFLYVVETGSKVVSKISISPCSCDLRQVVVSGLPIGTVGPVTLPEPWAFTGIAAYAGDLYLTSDVEDALVRVNL